MLRLLGIKKSFSGREIIHIPQQELEPGFHWLQGVNGSGKTTLLRIIGGLLPFDGDVRLNHISLKNEALAFRQKVSWAEAEPLYPAFLSGQELAALYADIRKATKKQTALLTDVFAVGSYLGQPTGTYSSGMLKRLSLLLAFLGTPSLILLDEPLATLDAGIAGILPQLMSDRYQREQVSFIYSSHQPFPAPAFTGERRWKMMGTTISSVE